MPSEWAKSSLARLEQLWSDPLMHRTGHWTLQLLADELVALEVVDSISHETVRKTLKKTA
jgi:hypothetical protein